MAKGLELVMVSQTTGVKERGAFKSCGTRRENIRDDGGENRS